MLILRERCPNTELFLVRIFLYLDWIRRFTVNLRIQSEYRKIRTRNNSVFGHFSRSVTLHFKSDKKISSTYIYPTCKYMFYVNNKDTRKTAVDFVLVSLLSTWNTFSHSVFLLKTLNTYLFAIRNLCEPNN